MDLPVATIGQRNGAREFVSQADLSFAATEQKEKVEESHGDLCVSLCIECSELPVRPSRIKSHRHAQCAGCRRLKLLGFAQRLRFFVKGGKALFQNHHCECQQQVEELKASLQWVSGELEEAFAENHQLNQMV